MSETGSTAPLYAAIDVGSNTVKMLIARRQLDGSFEKVFGISRPVRLGEGIHAFRLREIAIRRTIEAMEEFAIVCRDYDVAGVAAVGTSALRDAVNQDEFITRTREVGVEVEAISGDEEARLSFLAVSRDPLWRDSSSLLAIDIGGGSTEVIRGSADGGVRFRQSIRLGAVRLSEAALRSNPPTVEQLTEANRIAEESVGNLGLDREERSVGVGGTITTMAAVATGNLNDPLLDLHGYRLEMDEVERQVEWYASRTTDQRLQAMGLELPRADIILGGAIILNQVMQSLGLDFVEVSSRGLRWGLLYDRFGIISSTP